MTNILEKRIFLIATAHPEKARVFEAWILAHVRQPTIYTATDGVEAIAKLENVPPHIVIVDLDLPKLNGERVIQTVLNHKSLTSTVVIIPELPSEREMFIDELVQGRVLFVAKQNDESEFTHALFRALNFISHNKKFEFFLRFLAKGERLIQEGDKGGVVYILRQGRLSAFREVEGKRVELGFIEPGEFVGEMAYIQDQPRVASVEALSDSELIEIPVGTLERILFKRPSWSKALLLSLSKRLGQANQSISSGTR